jgi:hypothetical protein
MKTGLGIFAATVIFIMAALLHPVAKAQTDQPPYLPQSASANSQQEIYHSYKGPKLQEGWIIVGAQPAGAQTVEWFLFNPSTKRCAVLVAKLQEW